MVTFTVDEDGLRNINSIVASGLDTTLPPFTFALYPLEYKFLGTNISVGKMKTTSFPDNYLLKTILLNGKEIISIQTPQ